jgi:hypothetical protein
MPARSGRPGASGTLAVALALAGVGLSGCGGDEMDDSALAPDLEVEVPDIRGPEDPDDPYQGVLDERFVDDLPAYEEQEVTVLAAVDEVVSPRSFTITAPDDPEVPAVLVVTAADAAGTQPEAGDHLVIAATPVDSSNSEAVDGDVGAILDDGRHEDWGGETVLIATIVETAS